MCLAPVKYYKDGCVRGRDWHHGLTRLGRHNRVSPLYLSRQTSLIYRLTRRITPSHRKGRAHVHARLGIPNRKHMVMMTCFGLADGSFCRSFEIIGMADDNLTLNEAGAGHVCVRNNVSGVSKAGTLPWCISGAGSSGCW